MLGMILYPALTLRISFVTIVYNIVSLVILAKGAS